MYNFASQFYYHVISLRELHPNLFITTVGIEAKAMLTKQLYCIQKCIDYIEKQGTRQMAMAGGVQEMEVSTQTKYEKYVKVSNG